MKIKIDLECSPHEARAFFGLPDVRPMQDAVLAKLEKHMLEAVDMTAPEAIIRSWLTLLPGGPEQFQSLMARMWGPFAGASPPGSKES